MQISAALILGSFTAGGKMLMEILVFKCRYVASLLHYCIHYRCLFIRLFFLTLRHISRPSEEKCKLRYNMANLIRIRLKCIFVFDVGSVWKYSNVIMINYKISIISLLRLYFNVSLKRQTESIFLLSIHH